MHQQQHHYTTSVALTAVLLAALAPTALQLSVRRQLQAQDTPSDMGPHDAEADAVLTTELSLGVEAETEAESEPFDTSLTLTGESGDGIEAAPHHPHHHPHHHHHHHHHPASTTSAESGGHQGVHVTTGDPTLDLLMASLGERMSLANLMDALVVDHQAGTEAMKSVHHTAESMKKKKAMISSGRSDLEEQLQHEDEVEGQEGLGVGVQGLGVGVEEEGVGLAGVVEQQQTAEFTLEPHLGPAILPFQVPEGYFVPFLPRRAFGVVNGVARPPHGHGSFYDHRPLGLVNIPNSPAYGYLFSGYRRFQPGYEPKTTLGLLDQAALDLASLDLTSLDLAALGLDAASLLGPDLAIDPTDPTSL